MVVVLTPAQEASMKKVMRLSRELSDAQDEMSRLFTYEDSEVSEFEAEQRSTRPRLRLIPGGGSLPPRAAQLQR